MTALAEPAVEWSRWRACDVCKAGLGEPCMSLTGALGDGTAVGVVAPAPHGGRKARTGAGNR